MTFNQTNNTIFMKGESYINLQLIRIIITTLFISNQDSKILESAFSQTRNGVQHLHVSLSYMQYLLHSK